MGLPGKQRTVQRLVDDHYLALYRYAYRLTDQGVKVAVLLVLFHQRLCGPLAHSLFRRRPDRTQLPNTKLEAAFHKADNSIREIVELLEAA